MEYLFDMLTERQRINIKNYLVELSGKSTGVPEFIQLIENNPDLIEYLNFQNIQDIKDFILGSDYSEFDQLRTEASKYLKNKHTTLDNEMDEIQRTVQDLNRNENLNISVDQLVDAFKKSREVKLDKKIWSKLENTESNKIKRGEMGKVIDLAKKYNKRNPNTLKNELKSGEYRRPMILNFSNRYYLVAGNTRLSTAAAMGIKPLVYIAQI
jgi:hypothetical protein